MEPHPPHLHHSSGKRFSQYFYEFLMLFFAVFCGFIAENIRENYVEREKEKQYMESLVLDLSADTSILSKAIKYNSFVSLGLDSLTNKLFDTENLISNTLSIYSLNANYIRLITADMNDQTITQLRNSGGLRLIRNSEVVNSISKYWINSEFIQLEVGRLRSQLENTAEYGYGIFNRNYIKSILVNEEENIVVDPAAHFMIADKNMIINYANRLTRMNGIIKRFLKEKLIEQKYLTIHLIELIKREYQLS